MYREEREKLIENLTISISENQTELKNLKENYLPQHERKFKELRSKFKLQRRKLIYLTEPGGLYTERFFQKRRSHVRNWEMRLGKTLIETLGIKSIIDFGCANGSFIEGALKGGAEEVLGFELAYKNCIKFVPKNIQPFIKEGDVGNKLDCGRWECALSIEVAEHLIEEQADIFVDNLIAAAERYIILTTSNSIYKYHLNPQPKEYWIEKFINKACIYLSKETEQICKVWDPLCSSGKKHIIDHLMIFSPPKAKE